MEPAILITGVVNLILLVWIISQRKFIPTFYIGNRPMEKDDYVKIRAEKINDEKKRGSIFIPPSDVETAREAIIEKNREQGKATPISELRDQP